MSTPGEEQIKWTVIVGIAVIVIAFLILISGLEITGIMDLI